jgi:hypothetical protein
MVVRSSSGSGHGTVGAEKVVLRALTVSRIDLPDTSVSIFGCLWLYRMGGYAKMGYATYPADMMSRVYVQSPKRCCYNHWRR